LRCLLKKYAGFFPLWLAPEQVRIIPVKEKHRPYAEQVRDQLQGIRVGTDYKKNTLGTKVYAAQRDKVPYVVIVGDSEQQDGTIAVRSSQVPDKSSTKTVGAFIQRLQKEVSGTVLPDVD